MNFDLSRPLTRRMRFQSAFMLVAIAIYLPLMLAIFFEAVIPSLDRGTTGETFAVDSTTYTYMADSLRRGTPDPWVLGAMASFPNTTWTPVIISLLLNSAFLVMLANCAMFALSVLLLKRNFPISLGGLVGFLLINPTTTTSILCVNKEILDLVAMALFFCARRKGSRAMLIGALLLAVLNRYEICLVMLIYLFAESRFNPLRRRRMLTLVFLVLALNFVMPVWGARELSQRFEEAQYAGVIRALDMLQMHYLYFVAVIPKIVDNLFGQIPNPSVWTTPSSLIYINLFNNLSYVVLFVVNFLKRRLTLRSDLIYMGILGSLLVAQSLVVQPRYFYFLYIILCLKASERTNSATRTLPSPAMPGFQHA